jgi:hypothetical protein
MAASIIQILSPLNFLMNQVFISYCHSQIFELCHIIKGSVKWVPCLHGMARPQVADGGDGLQI